MGEVLCYATDARELHREHYADGSAMSESARMVCIGRIPQRGE